MRAECVGTSSEGVYNVPNMFLWSPQWLTNSLLIAVNKRVERESSEFYEEPRVHETKSTYRESSSLLRYEPPVGRWAVTFDETQEYNETNLLHVPRSMWSSESDTSGRDTRAVITRWDQNHSNCLGYCSAGAGSATLLQAMEGAMHHYVVQSSKETVDFY